MSQQVSRVAHLFILLLNNSTPHTARRGVDLFEVNICGAATLYALVSVSLPVAAFYSEAKNDDG